MDFNKNHVTNPASRRVNRNRQNLSALWQTVRWKKFRDEHARYPGAVCAHCKRPHGFHKIDGKGKPKYTKSNKPMLTYLTVNHRNRVKYRSEEEYLTWDEDCEVCCNDCNGMFEEGKRPCPVCSDGKLVRYIRWDQQMCSVCYDSSHPEEAAKRIAATKAWKESKKALLKKLRDEEKERVKKIKEAIRNRAHVQLELQ